MAEDGERIMQDDLGSQDGKGDARSDDAGRFSGYSDNKELSSKSLKIQNKVYYMDVKENRRGRFLKITEIPPNRMKNRLMIPMSFVPEMKDKMTDFAEFYASLDPSGENAGNDDDQPGKPLKSDQMNRNNRRYHFDLKQNKRGYFLKVVQPVWTSSQNSNRLAIPAQGIADIRNSLAEIVDEFGIDEDEDELNLPEAKEVRVEQKRFYFDVGNNNRGVFLRLSEVTNNYRCCVTIPRRGWERMRDTLNELCDKLPEDEEHRHGEDHD
ncbi:transcriptional activator protein Pur-beta-like [Dendronephthya gigantea]|uniref:transcriptional activator protein Pur-beta-like n=1 Tax=Dendronephthya gigantea TaxID=151771 RepID=UPI00106CCD9A|nr:transcriptional activator protein Pur-beta-like [Dendronephthya gigantea]